MQHLEDVLGAHPRHGRIDSGQVAAFMRELMECLAVVTVSADACLTESDVQELARCIELDLDCADTCDATMKLVARIGNQDALMLAAQVRACRQACAMCAEECERHASYHEHCRICGETCRSCARACDPILQALRHPAGTGR